MRHFINLKDISVADLRKILKDAKKRKSLRKNLDNKLQIFYEELKDKNKIRRL